MTTLLVLATALLAQGKVEWAGKYEDAVKSAAEQGKAMMVVFGAEY